MTPATLPRGLRRALLTMAVSITLMSVPAAAQAGPPDPADAPRRELLVTDGAGNAQDGGGGETPFGVELEGEDECPGDSAHDQYRVDSYMVPVDLDPTDLVFTAGGPTPPEFQDYAGFQMPLYKLSTEPFAAEVTAQQLEPGGPGPIGDLPPFSFGVYKPTPGVEDYEGGLPSGAYRIGIACTLGGRITNLWETTIELTQDPADEPVGMAWRVTGPQPRELESSPASSSGPIVTVLVAVAVAMGALAMLLHRSSKRSPDGPEPGRSDKVVA